MADIFVSYTSSDRDWAFWIGQELEKLGHAPHIHEWEIKGSEDIYSWMQQRIEAADHMLCVTSGDYLTASYSTQERNAALWKSAKSAGFALIVVVKPCEIPAMFANLKRYQLHDVDEQEASNRLAAMFVVGPPSKPVSFPGMKTPAANVMHSHVPFPGATRASYRAVSNIPIAVPLHFLGRDEDIAAIDGALKAKQGRAAITTALHGLRGVGKTTLAAAYAQQRRFDYRATWWIRAETISTMRADLVGLGVRLEWVVPDEKEEPALVAVLERLRDEGDGILLVYDNANNANEISRYMPHAGAAHIIVTSNAPNWSGVAVTVEIEKWPNETGAEYLVAQAGRPNERDAALALSEALDGLPLAHEQAAAYCGRTGLSLADYLKKFEAEPAKFLNAEKDASPGYYNRRTVAKTFALAIDEAAKLNGAAEPLIVYASLLAPEPIPLYLFSEAREQFGEPLASALLDDGLDEAVAALRAFALVDREIIADERDPSILTDCLRLHRLVRQVAAARCNETALEVAQGKLIKALVTVYPESVFDDPNAWPRARRLDALAMAFVGQGDNFPKGLELSVMALLSHLDSYRDGALAAYAEAQSLSERALAICERVLGPNHPETATRLNNLGNLLRAQGDLAGAQTYVARALTICEEKLNPDHPDIATHLNNLCELMRKQRNFVGAQAYAERALSIFEKTFGADHPHTAWTLNNLGNLRREQGDLAGAQTYLERALEIYERTIGPDHPDIAFTLNNLGNLAVKKGDFPSALQKYERGLTILETVLGSAHPSTKTLANNVVMTLRELGRQAEANALRIKFNLAD